MGGFLTIRSCLRTIGYCFPYCFLEILWRGYNALMAMEGDKVVMEGSPSPPTRENLVSTLFFALN